MSFPPDSDIEQSMRQEQFLLLLLPLRTRLAQFTRAMTADYEDGRDLMSDTVLVAFERFEQVREPVAFLSYLFTIAVRLHRRRLTRERSRVAYDDGVAIHLRSSAQSPESSADVRILYDALARLPERQREAVALFEISGLPLEAIRKIQGGTLSGVKARVARGRRRLQRLLDPEPGRDVEMESSDSRYIKVIATHPPLP